MKYLAALLFALSASSVSAGSCGGKDLIVIPEMEKAKDAFFAGEYEAFSRLMGPNFPGFMDRSQALFAPLENIVSGYYASCTTILQRHESPGFYQDLVYYYDDEVEGPITVLLVGADFDGEFRFVEFTFNTATSAVLDALR